MPRRREVPKREVLPDPKYGSQDIAKFINVLMTRGKKSVAEGIMYSALEQITKKAGKDALEVFNQAVNNVKPMVEVKSRRVGGANYQVPVEVRSVRRMALAMRWLRDAARSRGEKSMGARLAGELAEAAEGRGGVLHPERHRAGGRAVHARELLAETLRLGIDHEIDVALPVQRDVLAAVARGDREAHLREQRPQLLRVRRRVFDELEAVGPHRVFESLAHDPLPG